MPLLYILGNVVLFWFRTSASIILSILVNSLFIFFIVFFQSYECKMTMLSNIRKAQDVDCVYESCDLLSLVNERGCVENVQKPHYCFRDSEKYGENRRNCVQSIPKNTDAYINSLSERLGSVELIHTRERNVIQFDDFKAEAKFGTDIHGSVVQCRGPYIDVNKVYAKDDDGDTLLHIALIIMTPELVQYLIDMTPHFTWLNIKNKISQTPLHLAVLTNQVCLVRRLVVGGADIEARDRAGNTAIHLACRDSLLSVVNALIEPVRYDEQKGNNYDIFDQNIDKTLESMNYEGFTCLHIAANVANIEVVKTLLNHGADVNVKAGKSGRTILHEAAWSGNLDLVKFLCSLDSRCNINAKTFDGYTAFDVARARGYWSIVVELAAAGAKYYNDEMQ